MPERLTKRCQVLDHFLTHFEFERDVLKVLLQTQLVQTLASPHLIDHNIRITHGSLLIGVSTFDFLTNPPNVLQAMMQLGQAKTGAQVAKKVALETEKEKDNTEKSVEELKRQMQPKSAHTHDDTGDDHEMISAVDSWDLSVHHREVTHVKTRRNVQVGSLENQPKTRTGEDGFLCHALLGLVGWITYWCLGDSALTVIILVTLIKTFSLSVSDALVSRKQKEAETNTKIVDLLKHPLDEGCWKHELVEKEFKLATRKYEEYKGRVFYLHIESRRICRRVSNHTSNLGPRSLTTYL
jgi:hypothetical protein